MDINEIDLKDQFRVMLKKTRKAEIDREILSLEFNDENLPRLRELFERRKRYAETCNDEAE